MTPGNRSYNRNVFIYDVSTGEILGGFHQNGTVTKKVFLWMLQDVLLVYDTPITVKRRESNQIISPSSQSLQPGHYDVYCKGRIAISNETFIQRIPPCSKSSQEERFTDSIRKRDGGCVFSGFINEGPEADDISWLYFQAAHIFPLERESVWRSERMDRWITFDDTSTGETKINSVQNGFLLRTDIHTAFNNYLVSVNPDDDYKIVVFHQDLFGLDGNWLDPICHDESNPQSVSVDLLRWHFRQSVLANVRGAGEPILEHDFPPGTNQIGEISERPYAQERLEMEVAVRLRNVGVSQTEEDAEE